MLCYIYKLIHKEATNDDMIYIGSTINIKERMRHHKGTCNTPKNRNYNVKLYKYIRENGGWDAWKYEIITDFEIYYEKCKKRYNYEGKFIKTYDTANKLNNHIAGRTQKEWCENNNEKVNEIKEKWYDNNREKVKELKKKSYERNKVKNKDKNKKWCKNYRDNNFEKVYCDNCGSLLLNNNLKRHQQTNKCLSIINKKIS